MVKFSEHLNKDIADVKTSAEWDGSKWINKVKAQEIEDALATLLTKAGFDAKADVTLSALRDALRGAGSKTLTDLATALGTLNSKDFATETTLAAILAKIIAAPATEAKQNSLETVLKAIRDTAGIKKIVDPLPAGTNKIGKVEVDGNTMEKHGLLSNRPAANSVPDGFLYFAVDAESIDDKLCYAKGNGWKVVE